MNAFLTLAALAAGSLVAPAFAQDAAPAQRSAVVRAADLDLSKPAAVAELDRRIATSARTLCATLPDASATGGAYAAHRCRVEARDAATPRRDRLVAAAHGGTDAVAAR